METTGLIFTVENDAVTSVLFKSSSDVNTLSNYIEMCITDSSKLNDVFTTGDKYGIVDIKISDDSIYIKPFSDTEVGKCNFIKYPSVENFIADVETYIDSMDILYFWDTNTGAFYMIDCLEEWDNFKMFFKKAAQKQSKTEPIKKFDKCTCTCHDGSKLFVDEILVDEIIDKPIVKCDCNYGHSSEEPKKKCTCHDGSKLFVDEILDKPSKPMVECDCNCGHSSEESKKKCTCNDDANKQLEEILEKIIERINHINMALNKISRF